MVTVLSVFSGLISHPFFSLLLGFHPASGSCLPLRCGRPDGKLLCLRAWAIPSSALFTLGRISIKLALSLLLPSIANSVSVQSPFSPPVPFCYSKQMIIICFVPIFSSFHQSECSSQTRLLNVRTRGVCVCAHMSEGMCLCECEHVNVIM